MPTLIIRRFHSLDYQTSWQAMQNFTQQRDQNTPDELWLLEHPPVFTQGQAGKPEHLLQAGSIPVVQTDRGGQITYHGPGQLMVYTLFDLKRLNIGIRSLVRGLENIIINLLKTYNIGAKTQIKAPGVYVEDAKICSIGLRVSRSCSYHGLAFNLKMDLAPFAQINPCGFKQLAMTQLSALTQQPITVEAIKSEITPYFLAEFGYTSAETLDKELIT